MIATGFPYDHDRYAEALMPSLAAVLANVAGIRRFGSAALDLCWTACGRFDGYYEYSLKPWDIAAALLVVDEAGGVTTDPWGNPLHPFTGHMPSPPTRRSTSRSASWSSRRCPGTSARDRRGAVASVEVEAQAVAAAARRGTRRW